MIRSLALAVSLALGTVSISAHALGLGDIKSRSALNQNFDADIDLLSVITGEIDALRVRLATQDAFQRAGVERPFYLSLLKFKPTRLKDGSAAIHITSDFPIREPFLNFLVEVNWPKGRLVREYTVLLDPPSTTKKRAPKVTTSPAKITVSKARRTPVAKPTSNTVVQTHRAAVDEYGPVKENETLWGIAKSVRPSKGVSMEQMMIALQQANPQAFIDNNINRLRKGQILRVPDADEIHAISRAKAREAYREQQDEWLATRSESMQKAVDQQAAEAAANKQANGTSSTSSSKDDGQLNIAAARPEGSGDAGASEDDGASITVDDLQGKLLLARENAETSRLESEALRGQMGDLQKRLEDMQRLLSLKDNQLAQLQDNVAQGINEQASEKSPFVEAPLDPIAAAMEEAQASFDGDNSGFKSQDDEKVAASEISISDELIAAADAVAEDNSKRLTKKALPVTEVAQSPAAKPSVSEPAQKDAVQEAMDAAIAKSDETTVEATPKELTPTASTESEDNIEPRSSSNTGNFFTDNLIYLLGGGGLLVLLLLLLLGRKKSANKEENDKLVEEVSDESILLDDDADDLSLDDDDAIEPSDNDTSFLSEFSPSDINALQDETGEVDPVSEADVYIAYGRYQQSEELLTQALAKDPGRLALKHKLLEVYYATRNQENFVKLAQEMVDGGQDIVDEEAWLRVKDMGRELDAGNTLFAGGENESRDIDALTLNTKPIEPVAETIDEDSLTLDDLELDALASDLNDTTDGDLNTSSPDNEVDLSLDLEDLTQELESAVDEDSIPIEGLDSLELDLPDMDSKGLNVQLDEAIVIDEDSILDDDSTLSAEDLQAQLDELSDFSLLDDENGEMEPDKPETLDTSLEIPTADEALDQPMSLDNAFDEALDLDETIENVQMDSLSQEDSLQTDADAVATKLDLAKAYVEMGDQEGARSILEEVKAEGSDSQKTEAESLLSTMG